MSGPRVHQIGHPQLADIAKSLEEWMIHQPKNQLGFQSDKAVEGIVEDFVGQGQSGEG